jgi:tetratricopeptide (TPR) repeat protein
LSPRFRRARARPSDPSKLAEELNDLGDFQRALTFAERAVTDDPQAWSSWVNLSRALTGVGRVGEALAASERALALEPEAEWAHRTRSIALGYLGRRSEAIAAAREAVAISPNEYRGWIRLSTTANWLGDPEEARRAAERAVELAPDKSSTWTTLALSYWGVDWQEAVSPSEQALRLAPEDAAAINNLGWVRLQLGQFAEARELFDRAILIAPDKETWLYNRAIATSYLDGTEAGAAEFTRARKFRLALIDRQLAANPQNARAHALRAATLRGLGEQDGKGLAQARQAVSLDPRLALGWAELRECAGAAERWQLARYAARRAVACDPGAPDRWLAAAEVARHADHPREAELWANRVVDEAPKSKRVTYAKAILCYLDRNLADALLLARKDLERDPLNCCRQVFIATCSMELSDEPSAREALGQAERRIPTCGCFRRNRAQRLLTHPS